MQKPHIIVGEIYVQNNHGRNRLIAGETVNREGKCNHRGESNQIDGPKVLK